MDYYIILQHYWWFLVSLLGGILVFLLFVQGGQTLIYTIAKDELRRTMVINSIGHKWELTFTTLVTFGGAAFASFPLFYSTSFSGALYVWMLILFFFVIQAVSYEYRLKSGNLLGQRTYEIFLLLNGLFGTILLGAAVGTLFTGAEFVVNRTNIANFASGSLEVSQWYGSCHGLEAVLDYRNVALGLAVFFLSRVLAIQYFFNNIVDQEIKEKSKKPLIISAALFLVTFLTFLISILFSSGYCELETGTIVAKDYIYLNNLIEMPIIAVTMLIGIVLVLVSLALSILKQSRNAIWYGGIGTIVTVTSLLLLAGFNSTAYYFSKIDPASSLTITNSSSGYYTLAIMTIASALIPFVVAYIWYAWRQMNKKPITKEGYGDDNKLKY